VYLSAISWTLLLCSVFLIGTVINLLFEVGDEAWQKFWWIYVIVMFFISVITTIWFIIGGFRDYREMFQLLRARKADERDDGRVFKNILTIGSDNQSAKAMRE